MMIILISVLIILFSVTLDIDGESNFTNNNIVENKTNSQFSFSYIAEQLNESAGIAQWVIVIVLIITALVITGQISAHTNSRRGENFLRVVELLNKENFIKSIEEIKLLHKTQKSILEKPDSQLSPELRKHVTVVRETYQAIGAMIFEKMIDEFLFLRTYSLNARDAWIMLEENYIKTNEEINEDQVLEETYFVLFKFLGDMCIFWRSFSPHTRLALIAYRISVRPNSWFYLITISIRKLSRKIRSAKR